MLVVFAVSLIATATLLPSGDDPADEKSRAENWACIRCNDQALADAMANALLFVPLGAALTLAGVRRRRTIIAAVTLSTLIELAQIGIPGRDPSLRDVLANAVGGAVGCFLVTTAGQWLAPAPRRAKTLALAWTVAAAIVAWATMLLWQPSYPRSVYYGQWTPELGHLEWYRGRVLEARVGGVAVPSWRVDDSFTLRAELQNRHPIRVRALAGPPVPALGSLFSIADDRERSIVLLGPDQDDLVYSFRTRAADLRLKSPNLRARRLLRGVRPGDSLNVLVSWDDGDTCLSANGRRACRLSPGVSAGWALLFFERHFPAWLVAMLNAAWMAALAAPIGYWSPHKRDLATMGGGLGVAVLGASLYYGASASLMNLAFLALGLALGVLVRRSLPARLAVSGPDRA